MRTASSRVTLSCAVVLAGAGTAACERFPEQRIPPCESCHGRRGLAQDMYPLFPGLAGQHFDYLQNQLKLWRAGVRGGPLAPIMRSAVQAITDEQIAAVSAYYASAP